MVGSVAGLNLAVNNLHASTPSLLQPLKVLHDCGLFDLDLEVNTISGSLSQGWGQLKDLHSLNLGKACTEAEGVHAKQGVPRPAAGWGTQR